MTIIAINLSIVSAIVIWRLISFGVRSANRISRSTESSAAALQAIYDAMTPEAQQRADEAKQRRIADARAKQNRRETVIGAAMLIVVVLVIVIAAVLSN